MREESYNDCLAKHFSNLKFVLENGTLDEKAAVLGPISARADSIFRRTGQMAPRITLEQAEKCMAGKSGKEPLEKRLFYFLRDVIDHASFDDFRQIKASIPQNDINLYPLELIIKGIEGIISCDCLKVYIFLNRKMPVVQKSKVIALKEWVQSHKSIELTLTKKTKSAKKVPNGTEKF